MRYPPLPSIVYEERRRKLSKQLSPDAAAILCSHAPLLRTADQEYPYRQHSHILRFSGIEQPDTCLIVQRENPDRLFVAARNPAEEIWKGPRLSVRSASSLSGISKTQTLPSLASTLNQLSKTVRIVYLTRMIQDVPVQFLSQTEQIVAGFLRNHPSIEVRQIDELVIPLAMIKHKLEIDRIKEAVRITGNAFRQALQTIKPGMMEYEVEAIITSVITAAGASHAFDPIIASGKSAVILHYISNHQKIKTGDLILLDFGADYGNLAADMSRTIPASGKFTPRQRQIYTAVHDTLLQVTEMMRPGTTLKEINTETGKIIDDHLLNLKLATRSDLKKTSHHPYRRKFFMHGVSHHLGYDVHDLSDTSATLKPGMILTCEPGLYIASERLGIRLENDILVTRSKPINLMEGIPLHPDEIEEAMKH